MKPSSYITFDCMIENKSCLVYTQKYGLSTVFTTVFAISPLYGCFSKTRVRLQDALLLNRNHCNHSGLDRFCMPETIPIAKNTVTMEEPP